MSDLTVLLLILSREIVNKHNYVFMQQKYILLLHRGWFFSNFHHSMYPLSLRVLMGWENSLSLQWKMQSSVQEGANTSAVLKRRRIFTVSLSQSKVFTAFLEHQTAEWSPQLPKTPVVPYQTVHYQFNTAVLYVIQRWYTHIFKDQFKSKI